MAKKSMQVDVRELYALLDRGIQLIPQMAPEVRQFVQELMRACASIIEAQSAPNRFRAAKEGLSLHNLTPENLEDACIAAKEVEQNIHEWESLSISESAQRAEEIWTVSERLLGKFIFQKARNAEEQAVAQRYADLINNLPSGLMHRFIAVESRLGPRCFASEEIQERSARNASQRWARLDPVMEWAFQARHDNPNGSRAAFIKARMDTIKAKAREEGEPLSGDDEAVTATITRWFRKAGIA